MSPYVIKTLKIWMTWVQMVKKSCFLVRLDSLETTNLRRAMRVDQRSLQL